jgi:hypothetical protein
LGSTATECSAERNPTDVVGVVTVKDAGFDIPPPGAGLVTVTEAVLADAMSESGTVAFSCSKFTNRVLKGVPFQFTTEFDTNPVPFTVIVNP